MMIRVLLLILILAQMLPARAVADPLGEAPEPGAPDVPYYDPGGEAVRSLLLPGWSQYRQGHDNVGLAYAVIAGVTLIFATGWVEMPFFSNDKDNFSQVLAGVMYGANAVVSGWDAHRRATESNRENGWDLDERAMSRASGLRVALVRVEF